jgi:radical SAM protein with 4Fe4S-binding SPASM domain
MMDQARMFNQPPPIQLFLELTSVCNGGCTHCYVRAGEGPVRQVPPAQVCLLIEEFAELGGQMVSISGGEPTLYSEWRAVTKYVRYNGLDAMLLTNATRLSSDDIAFLKDLGCAVAVSLDGANAASHDSFRGAGNFDATLTALNRLVAAGMAERTTLMFTPMTMNHGNLAGIVALAHRLGIGTVYVSLLEDRGRAHDRMVSLVPGVHSIRSLIFSIASLQDRYPGVAIQCLNLKMFTERLRQLDLDTEGLDRTIRITADGEAYLTAYLDDEPFRLGFYKPGDLRRIWESDKVRSALDAAERRRRGAAAACRNCSAWEWCRGGSAAFAWNHDGSFDGEDGFCDAKRAIVREFGLVSTAGEIH